MTTNTFTQSTSLTEISDAEMLSIAYDLNSIEPGAGLPMAADASFWAGFALDGALVLNVFGIVLFFAWVAVVFAPTISQYLRMFRPMSK